MNILILHKLPFNKAKYDISIDHLQHVVYYLVTQANTNEIPSELRSIKIMRDKGMSIVDTIIAYVSKHNVKFDQIISLSEYEIMDAALLRDMLGINGATGNEILRVRNKHVMKQAIVEADIKTAKFMYFTDFIYDTKSLSNTKIILKPIDGAASVNTFIYNTKEELLKDVIDKAQIKDCIESYIVEEFIEGKVLHIDGLVQSGNIVAIMLNSYIGSCLEYAYGNPLGSTQLNTDEEMSRWAQKCISAVGIKYGSFHLEAISCNNELYFLEVANRAGGGEIVNNFELATGINIHVEEIKLHLLPQLKITPTYSQNKYGFFLFPGHHFKSEYCEILNFEKFIASTMMCKACVIMPNQKLTKHVSYRMNEVPFGGSICSLSSVENIVFLEHMFDTVEINGIGLNMGL